MAQAVVFVCQDNQQSRHLRNGNDDDGDSCLCVYVIEKCMFEVEWARKREKNAFEFCVTTIEEEKMNGVCVDETSGARIVLEGKSEGDALCVRRSFEAHIDTDRHHDGVQVCWA